MWHPTTWSLVLDSCAFGWSTCEVYIGQDFSEEVCIDNSDYTIIVILFFPLVQQNRNFVQNIMLISITLLFLGFDNPVLAAVSNAVTFKNPNEPLHGHLALTGNPTEMR